MIIFIYCYWFAKTLEMAINTGTKIKISPIRISLLGVDNTRKSPREVFAIVSRDHLLGRVRATSSGTIVRKPRTCGKPWTFVDNDIRAKAGVLNPRPLHYYTHYTLTPRARCFYIRVQNSGVFLFSF